MIRLIILALIISSMNISAKSQIRVAVIDTGIDTIAVEKYRDALCDSGHKDFTGEGIYDFNGHGTNVSGLIHKYARGSNYCQVIIKVFPLRPATPEERIKMFLDAVNYAIDIGVNIINISSGGYESMETEYNAFMRAAKNKVLVVAAAGNEGQRLGEKYCETIDVPTKKKNHTVTITVCRRAQFYPAMYKSNWILSVGNKMRNNKRHPSSNYGKYVEVWENGVNAVGLYGPPMTGTSQATAITTGKIVRWLDKRLRKR